MTRADQFEPLSTEAAERWAKFGKSETVFYPMLLGLEVEETRVDYCRMRMPFKPELLHPGGVGVTKRGRRVVFCESEAVGSSSGRLIAKSVLTYNVSPGA